MEIPLSPVTNYYGGMAMIERRLIGPADVTEIENELEGKVAVFAENLSP